MALRLAQQIAAQGLGLGNLRCCRDLRAAVHAALADSSQNIEVARSGWAF
jgi:hypothetical protein